MNDLRDKYIVFGSLRDKKVASTIKENLFRKGVDVSIYVDETDMSHLAVLDKESIPIALEEYKMAIGVKKPMQMPKEWSEIKKLPLGNFTFGVLIVCVLIFGAGYVLKINEVYDFLLLGPKEGDPFLYLKNGELWRALTPAFIHFGFLHIIFNLMWWRDLANFIENTKGVFFFFLFLLVTCLSSNLLQASQTGANFGGLSGVVYGLLGYLWIYKTIKKDAKYSLPKNDIIFMIGWFFLCLFDVFSFKAANYAHGGGLLTGMAIGLVIGLYDSKKIETSGE